MKPILFFLTVLFWSITISVSEAQVAEPQVCDDKLFVLWTSDDPMLTERMVLMYTHAAKKQEWFKEVTLIIWGPSARLTADNAEIQEKLHAMQADGVLIEACVVCADAYNVTDIMEGLGFDVKPMGLPLTDYVKSGAKVLTF
ncbi:MAG: DsrE family protein [Bacteroidales bacterium]